MISTTAKVSSRVMTHKMVDILGRAPNLVNVISNTPERLIIAFDIDDTALKSDKTQPQVTTTFSNRPILFEIAKHLRRGTTIALISGNDISEQSERTVNHIRQYFDDSGETSLVNNLYLFGMKGGNCLSFNEDGSCNEAHDIRYNRQHRIPVWQRNSMKRILNRIRSGIDGPKPEIEFRPAENRAVQLAIRPVKGDSLRQQISDRIKADFAKAKPPLQDCFNVMPAGSTTIDIDQIRINKGTTLEYLMHLKGLTLADTIVYLGDEMKLTSGPDGREMWGNDLAVLELANVIAMAVNIDQSSVVENSRVIPAGSGPLATLSVLQYFSAISEAKRLPHEVRKVEFNDCKVPVLEKVDMPLPKELRNVDFREAAVFLRVNTLMSDPVTGRYLDEQEHPTEESTVMAAAVQLLMKDIKIVLMSGDSRTKQVDKVVARLFELLKKELDRTNKKLEEDGKEPLSLADKIANITLYANNGATETTFTAKDGKLHPKPNNKFYIEKQIKPQDKETFKEIIKTALGQYRQHLKAKSDRNDLEARDYYNESSNTKRLIEFRDGRAQIALVHIMPSEREWLLGRIEQLMKAKGMDKHYVAKAGGSRAININSSDAGLLNAARKYISDKKIKHALYFGSEFFVRTSEFNGKPVSGNDMDILKIPENILIPFAMNPKQAEVKALKNSRVIAGGSGADAAYAWLTFIADNLEGRLLLGDKE